MAVPANICVAWPSFAANIPPGWVRETTLDSRYILGAAPGADTDLVTDRGALTHTHTSPSHNPTQNPHTHTFFNNAGDADSTFTGGAVGGGSASSSTHGHSTAATSNATTATNVGLSITVNAASNDLAFQTVIWIKSDGTPTSLPSGCIAFFESDSLPSGWTRVDGDVYLKGAGTGADGGATGGANTHSHTSPAHTHTQNAHQHTGTSSIGDLTQINKGTGADTPATTGHTHAVTLVSSTATNQAVTTIVGTSDGEPPFKKLNTIQSSGLTFPTGIIALWLLQNANIPQNWIRYTAMDSFFLRGAAVDGESGVVTGGSTQHTHTASACQPIQNPHTHTTTSSASSVGTTAATTSTNAFASQSHNHATWQTSTDAATNNSVAVSIDPNTANSAFPQHRTVIYIQFQGIPKTGVLTTYDAGIFPGVGMNMEVIAPKLTAEQEQAIWRGDIRHYPGALPGGTPR